MRRRLSAVVLGLVSVFALAGPVLADTGGGFNYRDSGSAAYASAWATECAQSTCTDTNVWMSDVVLKSGERFTDLCVDQFTYPIRGNGRYRSFFGCATTSINIASDLSTASASATLDGYACGQRSCVEASLSVSVSLSAIAEPVPYSFTSRSQWQNCSDSYRVRGESAEAQGTVTVDGTELAASGQIGSETFAFSTRCR